MPFTPYRGCKGGYFEGGVRGVGLIHGVGLKETGVVNDEMHHVNDWMPTLLSAAAALSLGDTGATHQIKLGAGEIPFVMGDGIDNWAMFGVSLYHQLLTLAAPNTSEQDSHQFYVTMGLFLR